MEERRDLLKPDDSTSSANSPASFAGRDGDGGQDAQQGGRTTNAGSKWARVLCSLNFSQMPMFVSQEWEEIKRREEENEEWILRQMDREIAQQRGRDIDKRKLQVRKWRRGENSTIWPHCFSSGRCISAFIGTTPPVWTVFTTSSTASPTSTAAKIPQTGAQDADKRRGKEEGRGVGRN